ncbi:hypothetical protein MMC31_006313 [Peltigera leucophlebia]|nr:hypothetical protein [Peltigera leucophlebia]
MPPLRRYLRITKYSVLECRIYVDNPADLREEKARSKDGKGSKKRGRKDVVVEEVSAKHSTLRKEKRALGKMKPRLGTTQGKLTDAGTRDMPVEVDQDGDVEVIREISETRSELLDIPLATHSEQLPVLRDGTRSIGGFHNILGHLHSESSRDSQDARERADIIAYSSFIEFHSQLRTATKSRTEYLDIFSLDLDSIGKEPPRNRNFGQVLIPKSLRSSRQTLSSLLQQTPQTSRFRLEALADAVFSPLEQLLDKTRYMLSNKEPSNLD